eukprot:CFRG8079T1
MKISDKLKLMEENASSSKPLPLSSGRFSIEVFPPKTVAGLQNLYPRLACLGALCPLFVDVTWSAGGETWNVSLEICKVVQKVFQLDAMLHVACIGMPEEVLLRVLHAAKNANIRNILALRGDDPLIPKNKAKTIADDKPKLARAVNLVKLIREHFGDFFCIGVAGFPEGRGGSAVVNVDEGIKHLVEKVNAGADFIVSQVFFDPAVFLKFKKMCRDAGVNVPIIPGLMPITSIQQLTRVVKLAEITLPLHMANKLESIRNDDAKVQEYGQKILHTIIQALKEGGVSVFHFFSMNLEQPLTQILLESNLVSSHGTPVTPTSTKCRQTRYLPFSHMPVVTVDGECGHRASENVRPIHWQYRPSTYMLRTSEWDRYPNGRWGHSSSPAYGSLNNYHLLTLHTTEGNKNIADCGMTIRSEKDVFNIMSAFIEGKFPDMVLPWHDEPVALETGKISSQLKNLNMYGFMTINSQPRVNGVPSSDPVFGWGPLDGVVYQKAYLEFFCSPERLSLFFSVLDKYPTISVLAENEKGEKHNRSHGRVQALTWGVFAESEIIQPTVTDQESFTAWREEAFGLWRVMWNNRLEGGTIQRTVLESMISEYFLVSVVDHNYVDGDIFSIFEEVINITGLDMELPNRKASSMKDLFKIISWKI